MLPAPITARSRRLFEAQFEPEGADYLYRLNWRGQGVRVTAAERDSFVAAFRRDMARLFWGFAALFVAGAGAIGFIVLRLHHPFLPLPTVAMATAFLALYMLGANGVWRAPAVALVERPVQGEDRSARDARALMVKVRENVPPQPGEGNHS